MEHRRKQDAIPLLSAPWAWYAQRRRKRWQRPLRILERTRPFRLQLRLERCPVLYPLAADDHRVIYQGAFGKREVGSERAMTVDTVFWIASMTKAITSAAAMQLVEQGKLSLDEPLSRINPELASLPVQEGLDDGGQAAAASGEEGYHPATAG